MPPAAASPVGCVAWMGRGGCVRTRLVLSIGAWRAEEACRAGNACERRTGQRRKKKKTRCERGRRVAAHILSLNSTHRALSGHPGCHGFEDRSGCHVFIRVRRVYAMKVVRVSERRPSEARACSCCAPPLPPSFRQGAAPTSAAHPAHPPTHCVQNQLKTYITRAGGRSTASHPSKKHAHACSKTKKKKGGRGNFLIHLSSFTPPAPPPRPPHPPRTPPPVHKTHSRDHWWR